MRNAILIMLLVSLKSYAAEPESVFRDALRYTVQIRTSIGIPYDTETKGSSIGAGFVVDASRGWIVTNAHVAGRAPSKTKVAFYEREFAAARKVYVDPFLDLAILEVGEEIRNARAIEAPLDCNGKPQTGNPVSAFGHPNGVRFLGTRGIVSGESVQNETEMLPVDAAISTGNSGGPLISLVNGRVIGINTEVSAETRTGYALPIPYVCRVIELLKEGKNPSPPSFPFELFTGIGNKPKLRVARSYATAEAPQILAGDEIVGVAGFSGRLVNETQLVNALRGNLDKVRLIVKRDGRELELPGRFSPEPLVTNLRTLWTAGVLFARNPRQFSTPDMPFPPVAVVYVEKGTPGDFEEIESGSFVVSADGKPVATLEDLQVILNQCASENRPARFVFMILSLKRKFFGYVEKTLPVKDLKWLNDEGVPLAAKAKD